MWANWKKNLLQLFKQWMDSMASAQFVGLHILALPSSYFLFCFFTFLLRGNQIWWFVLLHEHEWNHLQPHRARAHNGLPYHQAGHPLQHHQVQLLAWPPMHLFHWRALSGCLCSNVVTINSRMYHIRLSSKKAKSMGYFSGVGVTKISWSLSAMAPVSRREAIYIITCCLFAW